MFKAPVILAFLIICACYIGAEGSPCPYPNHAGYVHSGQIVAALNSGSLPLSQSTETQCYNYSLPYQFSKVPEVAIAVHDFESENSDILFFFIKTLHSESNSIIPFIIKTYWQYTRWTQISFSFLAEDRQDLMSGYYQLDSGPLSGCENGKEIGILMPLKNLNQGPPGSAFSHHLFLHGFQINTLPYIQNQRSPYQIKIKNSNVNLTGITVHLEVTSTTQVDSLYISYIVYQQTSLNLIVGSYVFNRNTSSALAYTPSTQVPRSYARIFGLSGFVINHNVYKFNLATRWDGFSFTFSLGQFSSETQYFSFAYIFFIGSQCQECIGYPISYNGTCRNDCPPGTSRTPENICIDCGIGKVWNGSDCIIQCPKGQYLNTIKNQCQCPPSLSWNGELCVSCSAGKIFIKETLSCECPRPLKWNGFACALIEECRNGKVWNVFSFTCKCPENTFWNGTFCASIQPCKGGQVHDMNYNCVCPSKFYWNGQNCTYSPCFGGQVWQGTKCVCPSNLNFNEKMCVECINGQIWDNNKKECVCEDGYKWNGQYCERTYHCSGNRVWNTTYNSCICKDNYYWSGYACLPIPPCNGGQFWNSVLMKCVCSTSAFWNGSKCIFCQNGQIWDTATLQCVCPPGTITISGKCQIQQQCSGGMMFMQNTLKCECADGTVWNGNFCISNPCNNGRIYSQKFLSCVCPENKVWTGQRCIPPKIACTNGKVWNEKIYACECPQGTYPNHNKCDQIPTCRNGMTYNPLTNQCTCPFGQILNNFQCMDPNCPDGQYFNGYNCEVISCPPPSYFYENKCVYGGANQCSYGYIFNGQTCVLHPPTCPLGTQWRNSNCQSVGSCQNGYYLDNNGGCKALPQQCPPSTNWQGDNCGISGNMCPNGTFYNNNRCQPYTPCKNGHVWNSDYLKCTCPPGFISNGVSCIQCGNGKVWDPKDGCSCPDGSFDTGSACEAIAENRCLNIPNTIWEDQKCLCRPGFTKVGFQCTCYGTIINDFCNKCSYKPHSKYVATSNLCQCEDGYTEIRGNCIENSLPKGNDDPSQCNIGTYFDSNHRMCLPCPDGCLSCYDCYRCRFCQPEFFYNPITEQCIEHCGDGHKYVLQCDDGNNKDGDGCSRDCKIEPGYTCTGGTPDNADTCYTFRPDRVTLTQTGQIRKSTSIVLNVKLNYLPNSLLFSGECANSCNQILEASIIDGDRSAISITSQFIIGTKYSFAVKIDFGRSYIGSFTVAINIASSLVPRYFGALPTDTLRVEVKPNYLAAVADEKQYL